MPPQSFLQRPLRWIQAISRYHATISGGPNFAYDMCARRITPEQRAGLDLSSWRVAYNGAEPVRADTLKRFAEAFASCGFRPRSSYPCYGLAEATLIVSGGQVDDDPVLCTTRVAALDHNAIAAASDPHQIVRTLVGCGRAMHGTKIIVVHPETMLACAPDEIGEIWVSSPSVAQGYWKRPDETAYTFNAFRSDTREGPFLRTGDLGFLKDGELFVTGRLKDLIIIGGRNLYPNDIELTVEQSHASVRSGGCAAFSVDVTDDERLIVATEVERRQAADPAHANVVSQPHSANGYRRNPWTHEGLDAVVRAIRRAVSEQHDIRVHAVVLLRAGGIPRTPSGKVQRRICQAQFRDGTLERSAQSE
jgi:acyl-CoA synthetase (AMP-forming)/AMP-acid ligase II